MYCIFSLSATILHFSTLLSPAPYLLFDSRSQILSGCYCHTMTCCAAASQLSDPLFDNIEYFIISQDTALSFCPILPLLSTPLCLFFSSVSVGCNPCCLWSGDTSRLNANHSCYLTPEKCRPSHSQWAVCFQSNASRVTSGSHRLPPPPYLLLHLFVYFSYLFPSLPTEDLRSVFTPFLYCFGLERNRLRFICVQQNRDYISSILFISWKHVQHWSDLLD